MKMMMMMMKMMKHPEEKKMMNGSSGLSPLQETLKDMNDRLAYKGPQLLQLSIEEWQEKVVNYRYGNYQNQKTMKIYFQGRDNSTFVIETKCTSLDQVNAWLNSIGGENDFKTTMSLVNGKVFITLE